MANAPFWQLAVLQAIGPLITVFVGSLAIGLLAAGITSRAQRRREEQQLRHDLIVGMAETASALYLATQRYWRARDREKVSADQLQVLRSWLDERYHESRVRGEALQTRLQVVFGFGQARRHWHATMDLLTVRYFRLTDPDNMKVLEENEGSEHSGLRVEELLRPKTILNAYHRRLDEAVEAVRTELLASGGDPGRSPIKALLPRLKMAPAWFRLGDRLSVVGRPLSPSGGVRATEGHEETG
jgi:hypothetical protein